MAVKKIATAEADDHILSLAWSQDGTKVLATPSTGQILLLSDKGETLRELVGHGLGNGESAFGVTCGFDGKVRIYDLAKDAAEPRETALGRGWIERAKWSPDGRHLAAALGKTLFILNSAGETVGTFSNHQTSVSDFTWNPRQTNEIASVCGGGARMWRLGEAEAYARFDWGGASLLVTWSPDGRWVVTGDQTASVHLYDFTRDHPLHIQGFETKVKSMGFSPDGRKLATGGGPMVTVWDCTGKKGPEGAIPDQLKFHKADVEALAWSPDGTLLATGDINGRLVVSDGKGKPLSAFQDEEAVSALAWSPDGRRLALGDAAGQVTIFGR